MRRNFMFATLAVGAVLTAPVTGHAQTVHATLSSHQEVPALSTPGSGSFRAKVDVAAGTIHWQLRYEGLEADATQSHVHFGQPGVIGGVSAFLCTNLSNGPAGTPACPLRSGELSGLITAASVLGPAGQGIGAGEFAALAAAILDQTAYVNVHTVAWPGGEIRGQLR
ncbi:MAG TPA: CHRD domain-containing protein [Steroidobacteraceae bacterium]|nr:CHRD domain-containing protein [Steroidobacteraceae bacterium]